MLPALRHFHCLMNQMKEAIIRHRVRGQRSLVIISFTGKPSPPSDSGGSPEISAGLTSGQVEGTDFYICRGTTGHLVKPT